MGGLPYACIMSLSLQYQCQKLDIMAFWGQGRKGIAQIMD